MTWDLIQNILIILLIFWNLSIIRQVSYGFKLTHESIRRNTRARRAGR